MSGRGIATRTRLGLAVAGALLLSLFALTRWIAPWQATPDAHQPQPASPQQRAVARVAPAPRVVNPVQSPATSDQGPTSSTPKMQKGRRGPLGNLEAQESTGVASDDVGRGLGSSAESATADSTTPPPVPPVRDTDAGNESAGQSGVAGTAPALTPATGNDEADAARDAVASASDGDEPLDDVPPATANAPAVRDAWLQRIHALIDSGDVVGARASVHAFSQRYPDYALPDDLRALTQ
jgi:hypothetical protein